jgi:hypothetical protein
VGIVASGAAALLEGRMDLGCDLARSVTRPAEVLRGVHEKLRVGGSMRIVALAALRSAGSKVAVFFDRAWVGRVLWLHHVAGEAHAGIAVLANR